MSAGFYQPWTWPDGGVTAECEVLSRLHPSLLLHRAASLSPRPFPQVSPAVQLGSQAHPFNPNAHTTSFNAIQASTKGRYSASGIARMHIKHTSLAEHESQKSPDYNLQESHRLVGLTRCTFQNTLCLHAFYTFKVA